MAQDSAARAAAHLAGQNVQYSEPAIQAQDGNQVAVLAADVSSSIITGTTVTGFTATLEAGKTYVFYAKIYWSSAATATGIAFEPTFSGTGTRRYNYVSQTTAATVSTQSLGVATGLIGPADAPASAATTRFSAAPSTT